MSESPITGYTKSGADDEFIDEGELATGLATKADSSALAAKANATALTAALPATVGTNGQVLKSNGTGVTWQTDANTTYTALTQVQAEDPASTAAGLATGQRIAQSVAANAPVKSAAGSITIPAVPPTGTHSLRSVEGVLTWIEEV